MCLFEIGAFLLFIFALYKNVYTGGPRYSRSFYLRFRLFAIEESIQNSGFADFPSLICDF
jgi:hypothetical protein